MIFALKKDSPTPTKNIFCVISGECPGRGFLQEALKIALRVQACVKSVEKNRLFLNI